MKILIEIPKLEDFQRIAGERGFNVEFLQPDVTQYHVVVSDKKTGIRRVGYVYYNRSRNGWSLDNHYWADENGRFRIWIGKKKTNIIGNLLKWMVAEEDKNDWHREYLSGKEKYEGHL